MSIVRSRFYNNPEIGQAFANLSSLFEPPSGADLAGYAAAKAKKEEAARLAEYYNYQRDPNFSREISDRLGIAVGRYDPSQSYYAVDTNNETLRLNNAADNTRALQERELLDAVLRDNNAADNRRALEQTRIEQDAALERRRLVDATTVQTNNADNELEAWKTRYGALNENQVLPALPAEQAARFKLPAMDATPGIVNVDRGSRSLLPDGRQIEGAPVPMTAEQWQASQNERLREGGLISDADLVDAIVGKQTPVVALKDNVPTYVTPGAAVREGMRAYDKGPSTVVNMTENGAKLGDPEPGLVWARNADGTVKLDERGAPIALPYQGGKRYAEMQDAERTKASKTANQSMKNDIVAEDIDRALTSIIASPTTTTGLGGQLTQKIGGTPANDVRALLDTIKANIGFDQLQAMREASPTGGALGQVTDNEQRLLQSVLGSLENSQRADQLTYNLKRLKNTYLDIIHGKDQGPPREKLADQRADGTEPIIAENPETGEKVEWRNGKWEPIQ